MDTVDDRSRYSLQAIDQFTRDLLKAAGVEPESARIVSRHMVEANLMGVDTHGVMRLGVYLERIKKGKVSRGAGIKVLQETPVNALVDGGNCFGEVVALKAMQISLQKAELSGVGLVGVRGSTNCGMLGYFTRRMAEAGFIGIALANAPAFMAPWGGRAPFFGTNPISFAAPAGHEQPVVLDMATSLVARGKLIQAARQEKKIPIGWAVDEKGRPTSDPNIGLKGLQLPMGGYKGYGLSLMIEILSAILVGANFGPHQPSIYSDLKGTQNTGHFFIAIRPGLFMPHDEFLIRMDTLIREIRACPRADGVERIYIPGELEYQALKERETNGIPLNRELVCELSELGKEKGVEFPSPLPLS